MKEKLKFLLGWAISIAVTFGLIYWFVLWGGWELFESGDPILIELGVSLVIGTIVFFMFVLTYIVVKDYSAKITELENRIAELEKKSGISAETEE